jgi:hypothetical protein
MVISPFKGFLFHAFEEVRNVGVRGQGACSGGLCPVVRKVDFETEIDPECG